MRTDFSKLGAQHFERALGQAEVDRIAALFGSGDRPGKRLVRDDVQPVADLLCNDGPVGGIASDLIGASAKPVRALLLDKSEESNWRLGWHQDRTIAVEDRIEVDGFGPWSMKAGQLHVQPPHAITALMATLRIHVDDVDNDNAPLEIIPGSHCLGRLSNEAIDQLAMDEAPLICRARSGDMGLSNRNRSQVSRATGTGPKASLTSRFQRRGIARRIELDRPDLISASA